jgi:hypothetical protein
MAVTSRKTAMGGALNLGLVASNTDQLLFIVTSKYKEFDVLDLIKIGLLGVSLFIQVNCIAYYIIYINSFIIYSHIDL